jgi:hypothetical protein
MVCMPGKHNQLNRLSSAPKEGKTRGATRAEAESGSEARKGKAGLRDKAADAEQACKAKA